MPVKALKEFLDTKGIKYISLTHSPAYTAQELAEAAHIPGRAVAKTVVVKLDGQMAMAVLTATDRLDTALLRGAARAKDVEIASESEFKDRFSGCEPGAMPPFGNLYGMSVFVDEAVGDNGEIAFNAGSHAELIRLPYKDFAALVSPKVAKLAEAA